MPTPMAIEIATRRTSTYASALVNDSVADGSLLITSKIPGASGNRIRVAVVVDQNPGPPVFSMSGNEVFIRLPNKLAFEASGPFYYNGITPTTFLMLWYAGQFNSRESFASDGLPVTWPLDRDGEFVIWAENSWNMIRRVSGVNALHWRSDSSHASVNLTPTGDKTAENPEGWYGVAAGCTGWVSAHYAVDHALAGNVAALYVGDPSVHIDTDANLVARISMEVPAPQVGEGRLKNLSARLSGGR